MSDVEQSQIYSPEEYKESEREQENQSYKRRVEKTNLNTVEGKWTEQENVRYILFMDYHHKIFASKEKRKSTRIFKSLSDLLCTRTPRQCRSHFQKIINKFKRVNHVKIYYMNQLGSEKYQRLYDQLVKQIEPKGVKCEDSEKTHLIFKANAEVQTDSMNLQLSDLPNQQILKLLNILQEYQKTQLHLFLPKPFPFDPASAH